MFLYYSDVLSRMIDISQEIVLRVNVLWGNKSCISEIWDKKSAYKINDVTKHYYNYSCRTWLMQYVLKVPIILFIIVFFRRAMRCSDYTVSLLGRSILCFASFFKKLFMHIPVTQKDNCGLELLNYVSWDGLLYLLGLSTLQRNIFWSAKRFWFISVYLHSVSNPSRALSICSQHYSFNIALWGLRTEVGVLSHLRGVCSYIKSHPLLSSLFCSFFFFLRFMQL